MVEVREQCKGCFHFQVCADVMKTQLFIREKVCMEENPQCEHYSPGADVVEVVRCKDCAVLHNKWLGCPSLNGEIPPPDFYCARGERKSDNGSNSTGH